MATLPCSKRVAPDLSFRHLVPHGLYTLWCFAGSLTPCGASDGSENSFQADAAGNASVTLRLAPLRPKTIIAIAYHSDGQSHGPLPGDFGLNTHVQLMVTLGNLLSPVSVTPDAVGGEELLQ